MGEPVTQEEQRQAERMARGLVVPPHSDRWYEAVVPLSVHEVPLVRKITQRLTATPQTPREAVKNAADLVDMAGASSSGLAPELWGEFWALARRHPDELAKE